MNIILCDLNSWLADAWKHEFRYEQNVKIIQGNILDIEDFNAIVAAGNSFGIMDGGLDALYVRKWGEQLQDRVRQDIIDWNDGYLPVGESINLGLRSRTDCEKSLIYTPTMTVPMDVSDSVNVFLSFQTALLTAEDIGVETLLCPGLGTGTGNMNPKVAAKQMYFAFRGFKLNGRTWQEIQQKINFLKSLN